MYYTYSSKFICPARDDFSRRAKGRQIGGFLGHVEVEARIRPSASCMRLDAGECEQT